VALLDLVIAAVNGSFERAYAALFKLSVLASLEDLVLGYLGEASIPLLRSLVHMDDTRLFNRHGSLVLLQIIHEALLHIQCLVGDRRGGVA